jgi:predicted sulfurtransferase
MTSSQTDGGSRSASHSNSNGHGSIDGKIVVAALYRFAEFPDFATMREPLHDVMLANEVRGTILLAAEGINGTIAGPRLGIDIGFAKMSVFMPFKRSNPLL